MPVGIAAAPDLSGALKSHFAAALIAPTTGAAVAALSDRVNGGLWTQATATKQPTFQPTGVGGQPALVFDGTDDALSGDAAIRAILNGKPGCTMVVVASTATAGSANRNAVQFSNGTSTTGARAAVGRSTAVNRARIGGRRLDNNAFQSMNSASNPTLNAAEVWTGMLDTPAALQLLYFNGALDISAVFQTAGSFSATNSQAVAIGSQANGAGEYWQGSIAEVLVYDRVLTLAELAVVHSYVQDRGYGITVSDYDPAWGPPSSDWSNVQTITTAAVAGDPAGLVEATTTVTSSVVGSRPSDGSVQATTTATSTVVGQREAAGTVAATTTVTSSIVGAVPTIGFVDSTTTVTSSVVGDAPGAGVIDGETVVTSSVVGSRSADGQIISSTTVTSFVVGEAPVSGTVEATTVVTTSVLGSVEALGVVEAVTTVSTEVVGAAPGLTGNDFDVAAAVEPGPWSATVEARHFAAAVVVGGWGSRVETT